MKVHELIKMLQQYAPEKTVYMDTDDFDAAEVGSLREYEGAIYIGWKQEESVPSVPVGNENISLEMQSRLRASTKAFAELWKQRKHQSS